MDNMKKRIKEALSKSMYEEEEKQFMFEGIDFYEEKTLDRFFSENNREDYIWEESLEESLYEAEAVRQKSSKSTEYKVGDIIMTNRYMSHGSYVENSPHRVLVITTKKKADGETQYSGFLFSSKVEKSNKRGRYPNNIYISDYSSVLYRGVPSEKEAFIRVDDLVTFTDSDLSATGSWKGKASWEFLNFVQRCVNNYRSGKDNSGMYWEK